MSNKIQDPTADEMRAFLYGDCNAADFEVEEAIYWFASDYHGGQWTNLYSALSTSTYSPGPCRNGPEDAEMYDALVAEYAS